MTTLVLLGAGASRGSFDVTPYPPPTGPNLYAELRKMGGVASLIPSEISTKFKENFEVGMKEYFHYMNGYITPFQRELSMYLAQFKPGKKNIYVKLINKLGTRNVIYSSLNYDLLFELSAGILGFSTNYSDKHINGFVRMLKIHGSSNFWPYLNGNTFDQCVIYGGVEADFESQVKPLNQTETLLRCRTENSLSPAIAMFAEGKAVRTCPSYVKKQYEFWLKTVQTSTHILIFGVRVHEVDIHIWSILAESNAMIYYFGLQVDQHEFEQWKNRHELKNATFIESDFESAISKIDQIIRPYRLEWSGAGYKF